MKYPRIIYSAEVLTEKDVRPITIGFRVVETNQPLSGCPRRLLYEVAADVDAMGEPKWVLVPLRELPFTPSILDHLITRIETLQNQVDALTQINRQLANSNKQASTDAF